MVKNILLKTVSASSLCTCSTVLLPNKQTTQEVMWTKERTLHLFSTQQTLKKLFSVVTISYVNI